MINNVKELELHLMELNDSVKNLVVNGLEATECHILLSELDKTLTRGKEAIVRENCCYAEAIRNIGNLARQKEHNDALFTDITGFTTFIEKILDVQDKLKDEQFEKILSDKDKTHKKYIKVYTKQKYELEFENNIGHYTLHFNDGVRDYIAEVDLFKTNRIYANSRIVKSLIENSESYIESYNKDEGYIIIRNDDLDKFAIFTSDDGYNFHYLKPESFCNDADRI